MITKKKAIMIALLCVGGIIVGLLTLFSPFVIIYLVAPNPPKPAITYAEFPFELVYEIDDETKIVNDIYVCEFDGFGMNEAVGKYREWKGYVKSTGEEDILLIEDDNILIFCSIGSAKYYMGDPEYFADGIARPEYRKTPSIYYVEYPNELGGKTIGRLENEHLEKYKVKLISWKLSDPIENTFE